MSVLDKHPEIEECAASGVVEPETLLTGGKVWLGKATEVRRVLPDREIRMIGAWCFLDHYGSEDVQDGHGTQVWAHPPEGPTR